MMKEEVWTDDAEQVICPIDASSFYTQVQPSGKYPIE